MEKSWKLVCMLVFLLNSAEVMKCRDNTSAPTILYKNLKGRELRVITGQFPPPIFFTRDASGNITGHLGYLYQQLLWLSEKLEFSHQIIFHFFRYNILPVKENTNGVKRNGTWNGIIGALLRDEADLGLVPMAISLERYEAVEFCGNIGGDWTSIVVRYPAASVSFSGAFDIFSIKVWMSFFISGALVVGFFSLIQYLAQRFVLRTAKKDVMNVGDRVLYIWGTIISQGTYFPSKLGSLKVLAVTWCLTAFVFVNTYNSTLASYMSVTYQKPEINSFNDVAISPTYKAAVAIGSIQEMIVQSATSGPFKEIKDKINKCMDCREWTNEALVVKVLEKNNFVAVLPSSVGRGLMQKFSSEKGNCRLTMANERAAFQHMFFAVPKTSPYIEEINLESLWFRASGIFNYWYEVREIYPKQCMLHYNSNGQSTSRSSGRLKLKQFYLPFLILFGGLALAFVQFIREKIYYQADG